ncbi:MAG: low specificity L-threonine aldolase [Alphaproteobacteria bacterium]|nr:low specificity L-threonine aldolase [Alphaproteobacteria bacterium]
MNFASDNITGAAPEVLAALQDGNTGRLMPYGNDEVSKAAEAKIAGIFETQADVFFVATGSAANALALSVLTPSWGAVFCHLGAHLNDTECGAPEFYSGGAKLLPIDGADGKFSAGDLEAAIAAAGVGNIHHCQPKAVSITQATETGSLYSLDEIKAISAVCKTHGLKLHMDGARFANAVAALGCSAADMTWKAGVDIVSFGATKNGALAAEAVVLFDTSLTEEFAYRRKRGGHLFSKMRLFAVQMDAYATDNLWLRNAQLANANAKRMADGLDVIPGISQSQSVQANILFPKMPRSVIDGLKDDGYLFYERGGKDVIRLVLAFDTPAEDIDGFIEAARKHAGS